jgi:type VI secretion system protein ImpG
MKGHYDDYDGEFLRRYYEQELEILRRDMRAFAQRHPEAAARLSINSDGRSEDPSVERLAQSAALLHARHSAKIDDDYPELSEALIERTYPQYLRPFPSCSVVQFDIAGMFESQTESVLIERGTSLETNVGRCTFRTAYDVALAPLRVARAQYSATPTAPPAARLPPDTSGMVSMTFCSSKRDGRLDVATPGTLRVHVAGPAPVVAALIDTMVLRTVRAYVEDGEGRWTRLADLPVKMVGFGSDDWLFTDAREPGQAFGLLGEYFAFAQRFHFVDIDFASLYALVPAGELTLHLVATGAPPNARTVQQLAHFSAENLKLFCTPVVNLFEKKDVSLKYDPERRTWPIEAQEKNYAQAEIWAVDRVCTVQGTTLRSSGALIDTDVSHARPRWKLVRGGRPEGSEMAATAALSLEIGDRPAGAGAIDALLIDMKCSNGDVPRSLSVGAAGGDMRMEGKAKAAKKIALLYAPTAAGRLSRSDGALWRLIGQQSAHAVRLSQAGLPALKQMLQQFAALSPAQSRHIDGIKGLRHRAVMTLIARGTQPAMVRGIEITLEIDEQLFVANSVAVFARVMERFFGPYASANSFIQVVVVSVTGTALWQGKPVRGAAALL